MRLSRRITTVIRTYPYFITFVPRLKINRRYYIGTICNIMNSLHFRISVSSVRPSFNASSVRDYWYVEISVQTL